MLLFAMLFLFAGLESSGSERNDREGEPAGDSVLDDEMPRNGKDAQEEEEYEEEEEEEPRLKYQRLSADVAEILSGNAASCLCVSDKLIALGVHDGTVHVLDIAGDEVNCHQHSNSLSPSLPPFSS